MSPIKILALDIETSPNLADVWTLWNNNVSLSQLRKSSELLCFSARWVGEDDSMFYSAWDNGKDEMVRRAHELLSECDAALHYNGNAFDIPYLNKEFLIAGFPPPEPYSNIDLYKVVRRRFKFPSNKLDYVSKEMGFTGKIHHEGHELWVKVASGDPDARRRMMEYNIQDTDLLIGMYDRLLPWIPSHPNVALIDKIPTLACNYCGSRNLVKRGTTHTPTGEFEKYQCLKCGAWTRGVHRLNTTELRGAAL